MKRPPLYIPRKPRTTPLFWIKEFLALVFALALGVLWVYGLMITLGDMPCINCLS